MNHEHGNFVYHFTLVADPNGAAGNRATEWRPRRIRAAAAITAPTCSAFSDPHQSTTTTTTPEKKKKETRKKRGKNN